MHDCPYLTALHSIMFVIDRVPFFGIFHTIACVNKYNDGYCLLHAGNCWRQSYATKLINNCRKTCVCSCCPTTPGTTPANATTTPTTTTTKVTSSKVSTTPQTTTERTGDGRTTVIPLSTQKESAGKGHLCPGLQIIRCMTNFYIQHEMSH